MQGFYPPFDGIPELKNAGREFAKAFLDLDLENKHIIPTCGSLQGGYISQALAGNMIKGKKHLLRSYVSCDEISGQVLGLESIGIDLYDYRGEKLINEIKKHVINGQIGGILWSRPIILAGHALMTLS